MNRIMLWKGRKKSGAESPQEDFQPYLEPFLLPGDEERGVVIVCPGGGYSFRTTHESAPVAERFNELGFHAFTLQYRVAPYTFPAPQQDALRAIKIVRSHAAEWHIKSDKIAILGFSAGGHLACSTGIVFDEVDANDADTADAVSARPDAIILSYPVISGTDMGHRDSFQCLLGKAAQPQELRQYSWEHRVKDNTPPSFLWHAADDLSVPVENSLNYAMALRAANIPFEMHVYPHGGHGLGLGRDDRFPEVRNWPDLCAVWLRKMNW